MTEVICKLCLVSGRVQGVFYRATTAGRARELGLAGWVRNLADGRVEVRACGEKADVEALCQWLWQGPAGAQVSDVSCLDQGPEESGGMPAGFTTR